MTVAAFVLGVLGFGVGVASLTWQVYTFLIQGARPRLTPVIGLHYERGLITNDASDDAREALLAHVAQFPPGQLVIGVRVVNAGRAPFHVARWAMRSDPAGTLFVPVDDPIGCPAIPCDIPAGAEETFFTGLINIRGLASISEAVNSDRQRLVATVSSGGRTYVSKPVAAENLAIEP